MPSLSISSSMKTAFLEPARRRPWMICPGRAPMYVRRCPRISASSRMPPSEMRWNFRPMARAMERPSEVLPTPGGPTKQRMGSLPSGRIFLTARYSRMRSLILLQALVVLVEDRARGGQIDGRRRLVLPGHGDEPVDVRAGHRVLGGGRRHLGQPIQLAKGLRLRLFGHAGGLDLLAQPSISWVRSSPEPSSFWMALSCSRR